MSIYPPTGTLEIKDATLKIAVIDLQYTSNTAKIEANSNVVTEFSRSKKLIKYPRVGLGTNTSAYSGLSGGSTVSGYTIKASNEYNGNFLASKAFTGTNDTNDLDTWITSSTAYSSNTPVANSATLTKFGQQGSWLEIKLPNAIQLHYTHVFSRRTHITERNDTADIWASNTGNDGDWVKLAKINFNNTYTDTIPMVADIDTPTYYQYFAIQITKINWSGSYANIGQWELYGIPEYDPEAHGVDVVVKSLPNVPNTDWLEVYYDAKDLTSISGTIADLSGKSVTGSLNGDVSIDTLNDVKSFSFDGSGDYIKGNLTNTGDFDFTVSLWLKKNTSGTVGMLWNLGGSGGSGNPEDSVALEVGANNNLEYFIFSGAQGAISNFGTTYVDRWVHVVATRSGNNLKIYLDGTDQNMSISGTDTLQLAQNTEFTIGARGTGALGNNPLNGSIANFRVFNRALTSDEIYQLYAYQKEYFGHGVLGMTLKAGRLGIGTSEPKATLDIRGDVMIDGYRLTSMYPGFASGGDDIYDVDGYRIHVFTNSGTFVVPGRNISADVLVVGGGGGGGQDNAGGGGAGGLIFKPNHTFAGRGSSGGRDGYYVITIGSGGIGNKDQNTEVATAGNDTIIRPGRDPTGQSATYTRDDPVDIFKAVGGGPGDEASDVRPTSTNGGSGGGGQNSEGKAAPHTGGTSTQSSQSGDSGTFGYGNNGGTGVDDGGGGGGGAGTVGQNGDVLFDGAGGNGGDGYNVGDIFGTRYGEVVDEDVYFAGGGAGSNRNNINTNLASGGKGGGGSAGATPQTIENGLPGTGGGGAGAPWETILPTNYQYNNYGGDGGSGIVIIRYRL